MKRFKKTTLALFFSVLLCFSVIGCEKQQTPGVPNNNVAGSQQKTSYALLAEKFKIDEKELENILTKTVNEKTYKLTPMEKTNENFEFWKQMMVYENEKYMYMFFNNRRMKTLEEATADYNERLSSMWMNKKPETLILKINLNGENAGMIQISFLVSSQNPYFGYITLEKFKGQGVATNALEMSLNLLRKLKSNGYYQMTETSLTIMPENTASIIVAEKNGFKRVESEDLDSLGRYRYNKEM